MTTTVAVVVVVVVVVVAEEVAAVLALVRRGERRKMGPWPQEKPLQHLASPPVGEIWLQEA